MVVCTCADRVFVFRFWKMANTFTGLKLQGLLGSFGKTTVTDIEGYVELPDGKVQHLIILHVYTNKPTHFLN